MKKQPTKKLFAFILIIIAMFSFTVADAQCYCSCDAHPRFNAECVTRPNGTYRCRSVNHSACGARLENATTTTTTTITTDVSFLEDIYPNPVSASTTVSFHLGQTENVSLKIFDVSGRLVTILADASFEKGDYEITWNAIEVNSGIYFLWIETASYSENRKLIVTK